MNERKIVGSLESGVFKGLAVFYVAHLDLDYFFLFFIFNGFFINLLLHRLLDRPISFVHTLLDNYSLFLRVNLFGRIRWCKHGS